jgi:regulator of sigma E protease
MDKLISVLASPVSFIVLISVVITVHELGHYWAGRMFGAAIESFSLGFGRPIVQFRDRRGTRWRINWLPLGGFVKFVGEIQAPQDSRAEAAEQPPTLVGKPYTALGPLKRMVVSLGGPAANFIFAIFAFAVLGLIYGVPAADHVRVVSVQAGSPAESAGFKVNDIVLTAGGRTVQTREDITQATALSANEPVEYRVERDGQPLLLIATPRVSEERNEAFKVTEKVGRIGLGIDNVNLRTERLNPIQAVGYGVSATGDAVSNTITVLRRLLTGKEGLDKLSGPVGIFNIADTGTDLTMGQTEVSFGQRLFEAGMWLVSLAAVFSVGVGFFNLLPIPVLDGGAVVMCAVEALSRREIPEKIQQTSVLIGAACLGLFALAITWNDLGRIFGWDFLPQIGT